MAMAQQMAQTAREGAGAANQAAQAMGGPGGLNQLMGGETE